MWKHYVAGISPSIVLRLCAAFTLVPFLGLWRNELRITTIIMYVPGFLAGLVGHLVAVRKSKQPPQTFRDVMVSFVLGILFAIPSLIFLWLLIGS
jgi:hypothetical protein